MKKFIKGTLELDKDVTDLVAYEEPMKAKIDRLNEWCTKQGIQFICGTSDDNTYLCEYKIIANTKAMCKGLLQELKSILKDMYPYVKEIWQGSGDILW
jgi:hypothetical protein